MTAAKEWKIARTMAHLWIDGRYSGISVSIKNLTQLDTPTPEMLEGMNLPPLPRRPV